MTPSKVHDEAYDGLLKSFKELVPLPHLRLRIYSRDAELFDSDRHPNRSDAPQILSAERDRQWTTAERDTYNNDVNQLVTRAQIRNADADTIEAYQRLINDTG